MMQVMLQRGAMGRGSYGPLWSAAQLSPRLWLTNTSPVSESGGTLSSWHDKSGASRHLSAHNGPTVASSQIAGKRAVTFDGSNDYGTISSSTDIFNNVAAAWMLAVMRKTSLSDTTQERSIFFVPNNADAGTARFFYSIGGGGASNANKQRLIVRRLDSDLDTALIGTTLADTDFHIHFAGIDWANGDGFVGLDGETTNSNASMTSSGATSNTLSVTNAMVAANFLPTPSNFGNVQLAELIVFADSSYISTQNLDRLIGAAAHYWQLTDRLGSSHPYHCFAPRR